VRKINFKKILVTGGNGFIGTNLINELLKYKKNKIINIDKFSYSSNSYLLKNKNKNLKNIKIDLLNFDLIKKIIFIFKPDLVFHLAADTHVDVSLIKPLSHYDNNIKATLYLLSILQLALKQKILKKEFKFIHVGTDEIYGDISFRSNKVFNEHQPLDPNNPYAASKAATVLMVKTWYKNFNFPCIVTNSVNNYGIYQFIEKFIPRSIVLAMTQKYIEVYGKGKNIRTWISVKDHVRALIFLAKQGRIGQMYNISSGYKLQNIEIAKKIIKILKNKKIKANIKLVEDRLGHDRQYSINANKLRSLGWKPIYNFDEELLKMIDWYGNANNLKIFKNINKHLLRKGII
jgi:dTDP-glucose 4,6-dehydratase